ncbi:helix-turn-helix domain-containing protein [Brevundimonas lutea]|uniref:helix-turn-helix domain-containing protein n=1 Tax=Brevundimonas lutea TaxID=2293980 RepID=UPI000F04443E|nr:AraC family transcriptional regulator [Brevundimonas lutea]
MPDALEMVLRGGAATTFLVLAVILLRDGGDRTLARLGALFALSTGWWALNIPPFVLWAHQWAFPLLVVAFGKAAAFWLFTRALFDDDFRMRPQDWVIWGTMVVGGGLWMVSGRLGLPTDWIRVPHQIAQVTLALSAAWIAWRGRGADLLESRRRTRVAFVLISALFMVGITTSYLAPGRPSALVVDLNVIRIFVTGLAMAWLVAGLRTPEIFARAPATATPGVRDLPFIGEASEVRLHDRLRRAMEVDKAFRAEGLTIGALAARIGAPEYALRRLINRRLGYRNFNAYLNAWRLAEARAALADPAQHDVPISTIALDAGFNSLGPFNRAFKAAEGMTPSEFRLEASLRAASPIAESA